MCLSLEYCTNNRLFQLISIFPHTHTSSNHFLSIFSPSLAQLLFFVVFSFFFPCVWARVLCHLQQTPIIHSIEYVYLSLFWCPLLLSNFNFYSSFLSYFFFFCFVVVGLCHFASFADEICYISTYLFVVLFTLTVCFYVLGMNVNEDTYKHKTATFPKLYWFGEKVITSNNAIIMARRRS